MKAHIGVDANSGLVHSPGLVPQPMSVDVTQAQALLHGDETDVFGDAGYQGVEKREENQAFPVTWHVAMRPSKRKNLSKSTEDELLERIEHTKASIRAKVEHPFHGVKNLLRHRKAGTRGWLRTPPSCFCYSDWPI